MQTVESPNSGTYVKCYMLVIVAIVSSMTYIMYVKANGDIWITFSDSIFN